MKYTLTQGIRWRHLEVTVDLLAVVKCRAQVSLRNEKAEFSVPMSVSVSRKVVRVDVSMAIARILSEVNALSVEAA